MHVITNNIKLTNTIFNNHENLVYVGNL